MNNKRFIAIPLCAAVLLGALTGCATGQTTQTAEDSVTQTTSAETLTLTEYPTAAALLAETTEAPNLTDSVEIQLFGSTATISGTGADFTDGVLTIHDGGGYVLSGSLTGRVVVNAPDADVTLVLNHAEICCSDNCPLDLESANSAVIYLPDGTENTLTDGAAYKTGEEEPDACLFSKTDLIIAGSGSLTVQANYKNGITGKDTLKIESATVTVTAANHGINGKDCLVIQNGTITVTSAGDGLRSTNTADSTLGCVVLYASDVTLNSGEDGVQAETALFAWNVTANVTSGGGSAVAPTDTVSAKGLKGGALVELLGGSYTLNCSDDAVHSNGNVTITDGSYTIQTGDDGIHSDETLTLAPDTMEISQCYEGLEGKVISITDGNISIVSDDDGINATDGTTSMPGGFGGNSDCKLEISGGIITIDASGDGLDSNGEILVSGGQVYVSGPVSDGDSALDYDGTAVITGGTVIAAGFSGMAQNFGTDSTQGSILLTIEERSTEAISVSDASGKTLAAYTPAKAYTCVVISCPDLELNGTYTVCAGGESTEVTLTDSLIYGSGGMMGGGFGSMSGEPGKRPNDEGMGTPPEGDNENGGTPPELPEGAQQGERPERGQQPHMQPGGSDSQKETASSAAT